MPGPDDFHRRTPPEGGDRPGGGSERSAFERGADEVRSWFGDEDAERRRRQDQMRDPDTWHAERSSVRGPGRGERRGTSMFGSSSDWNDDPRRGGNWHSHEGGGAGSRGDFSRRNLRGGLGGGLGGGVGPGGFGASPYPSYNAGSYPRETERVGQDFGWDRGYEDRPYGGGGPRQGSETRGHYGRGPKNDSRSKERIHERLCDKLHDDHQLDASDIEIGVDENGEVTLAGTVDGRWEKRRAEDCAYSVRGVEHVQNNLRLRPRGETNAEQRSA